MIRIKYFTKAHFLGVYIATGKFIIAIDKIQSCQHFKVYVLGKFQDEKQAQHFILSSIEPH